MLMSSRLGLLNTLSVFRSGLPRTSRTEKLGIRRGRTAESMQSWQRLRRLTDFWLRKRLRLRRLTDFWLSKKLRRGGMQNRRTLLHLASSLHLCWQRLKGSPLRLPLVWKL